MFKILYATIELILLKIIDKYTYMIMLNRRNYENLYLKYL